MYDAVSASKILRSVGDSDVRPNRSILRPVSGLGDINDPMFDAMSSSSGSTNKSLSFCIILLGCLVIAPVGELVAAIGEAGATGSVLPLAPAETGL